MMPFGHQDSTAGAERTMRLADVIAARQEAWPRPSWGAIMTKAFALAARDHAEMRQGYFGFPWGHIGEYESQVGCVVMTRRVADEEVVFLGTLPSPENQSLQTLDAQLRHYQEEPVEKIRAFREAMRLARLPRLVSRFLFWLALEVLPRRRVRHFGTFGVTTMSPFGAKTLTVPSMFSVLLHYGAMTETGDVPVGLSFDHRVMDGAVVGYTLMEMEQALHHDILAELRSMKRTTLAA